MRKGRTVNYIQRAARTDKILKELLKGNTSADDLAAEFGIAKRQVHLDIQTALNELHAARLEDVEVYRSLELARLDQLSLLLTSELAALTGPDAPPTPLANVVNLANTILKLSDQRAKLQNLYIVKTEVTQKFQASYTLPEQDAAEMLKILASLNLLPLPDSSSISDDSPSSTEIICQTLPPLQEPMTTGNE